ncbi:NAD(P)-dependent oxidoreductase [bacterium]|nr:MAG: NAD(P)-dependent oxidoreductase [bacterium]
MQILLAGASGFIGKNFIRGAPENWRIAGIYRSNPEFARFAKGFNNLSVLKCDLSNPLEAKVKLSSLPEYFDTGLFIWGNSDIGLSCREPLSDLKDNLESLINLVSNVKFGRFIFMSSGTVYMGQSGAVDEAKFLAPTAPYGVSKLASELYLRFFAEKTGQIKECVNIRFFGAYGPMEPARKIFTNLVKRFYIEKRNEFTLGGDGKNLIDAMYIEDTVEALKRIILAEKANLTLDLCKGEPMALRELVLRVADILGVKNARIHYEGESNESITFYASPEKAERLFGLRAKVPLDEGIIRLRDYITGVVANA